MVREIDLTKSDLTNFSPFQTTEVFYGGGHGMEVTGVTGETRETRETRVTEASKIEEEGGGGGEDVTMAERTMNKER